VLAVFEERAGKGVMEGKEGKGRKGGEGEYSGTTARRGSVIWIPRVFTPNMTSISLAVLRAERVTD